MITRLQLKVKIPRNVKVTLHPFTDYFKGFEKVEAVRRIFGDETEQVLGNLRVEFAGTRGYMGVSSLDGHLLTSANYVNKGNRVEIYLDVIHELVHVKQFWRAKSCSTTTTAMLTGPLKSKLTAMQLKKRGGWGSAMKESASIFKPSG